jgi:hypothetical protein
MPSLLDVLIHDRVSTTQGTYSTISTIALAKTYTAGSRWLPVATMVALSKHRDNRWNEMKKIGLNSEHPELLEKRSIVLSCSLEMKLPTTY